ncbi:hypothetical protein PTI98_004110 [Pleurotus ostreatus]|nr:hypothetical protein PTI98_004110 [Pleurotus ostreatus]
MIRNMPPRTKGQESLGIVAYCFLRLSQGHSDQKKHDHRFCIVSWTMLELCNHQLRSFVILLFDLVRFVAPMGLVEGSSTNVRTPKGSLEYALRHVSACVR